MKNSKNKLLNELFRVLLMGSYFPKISYGQLLIGQLMGLDLNHGKHKRYVKSHVVFFVGIIKKDIWRNFQWV